MINSSIIQTGPNDLQLVLSIRKVPQHCAEAALLVVYDGLEEVGVPHTDSPPTQVLCYPLQRGVDLHEESSCLHHHLV